MNAAPTFIDHYEVVGLLGAGAMGEVYEVRDTKIKRRAALKMMKDSHPEATARFEREAEAAGGLDHPNIVRIYGVGLHAGRPYIVMELVEGMSLAALLAQAQPSLVESLELMIQLCSALAYAHRQGVIHRDIKPGNIMVTSKRATKLVDFGIAYLDGSDLTMTGTLMGTVRYMAPEQVRGDTATNRTDIFSVGAVLYELVTGQRAFPGQYRFPEAEPTPPHILCPALDSEVATIVMRALATAPSDRYASIDDMQQAMQDALRRLRQEAETARPRQLSKPETRPEEREPPMAAVVAAVGANQSHRASVARFEEQQRAHKRPARGLVAIVGAIVLAAAGVGIGYLSSGMPATSRASEAAPPRSRSVSAPSNQPPPAPATAPADSSPQTAEIGSQPPATGDAGDLNGPLDLLTAEEVRGFVQHYLSTVTDGEATVAALYADRVDYFNQGIVGRREIARDKRYYFKRWPNVSLELIGGVTVAETGAGNTRIARFTSVYDVRSPARNARATGTVQVDLTLVKSDGEIRIVRQREAAKRRPR